MAYLGHFKRKNDSHLPMPCLTLPIFDMTRLDDLIQARAETYPMIQSSIFAWVIGKSRASDCWLARRGRDTRLSLLYLKMQTCFNFDQKLFPDKSNTSRWWSGLDHSRFNSWHCEQPESSADGDYSRADRFAHWDWSDPPLHDPISQWHLL